MILLKLSRFSVEYDDKRGGRVFVGSLEDYEDVTDKLSPDEKIELIDDLIYAISDLMKREKKKCHSCKTPTTGP